jgi:hypothetical protein
LQLIQEDDNHRLSNRDEVLNFFNNDLSNLLKNFTPNDFEEIEENLARYFNEKNTKHLEIYLKRLLEKHNREEEEQKKLNEDQQTETGTHTTTNDKKNQRTKTPGSPKTKPKSGNKGSNDAQSIQTQLDEFNLYFSTTFHASYLQSFVSKAICFLSTKINQKSLFLYLSDKLNHENRIEKYSLPIPMITVLQNGKGFSGKQYLIKEIILMPKPNIAVQEVILKLNIQSK